MSLRTGIGWQVGGLRAGQSPEGAFPEDAIQRCLPGRALTPLSRFLQRHKLLFKVASLFACLGQNGFGPTMQGGVVKVSHICNRCWVVEPSPSSATHRARAMPKEESAVTPGVCRNAWARLT